MHDLISRQAAIDEVNEWIKAFKENGHKESAADAYFIKDAIKQLPSAQPYTIHSDGRLWITVDDIDKVTAVVVDEHKSKFCKQFYEDYEDAQPEIIRCKECKWWTKQDDSLQGRCALLQIYPTGGWFCGSAERRKATA